MSFTVFTDGTLADANEVMDNFYWICNGDRLPRGGAGLDPTNGAYDIGSSVYYWSTVYCDALDYSGTLTSDTMWLLLSDLVMTTGSIRLEVSGLNGDLEDLYKISYIGADTLLVIFNGDSSAAYQWTVRSYAQDFWKQETQNDSNYFQMSGWLVAPIHSELTIIPDSGYAKQVIYEWESGNNVSLIADDYQFGIGTVNANITGTLTSIVFYSAATITADYSIKIFRAKNV